MKLLNLLQSTILTAGTLTAHAAIIGAYTPDANTVQLWSFDEAPGSTIAANDVGSGVSLNAVNITGDGTTTSNTGILGAPGFLGFGNAANVGADVNDGLRFGTGGTKTTTTALGINDAFTLEALIRTSTITGSSQEIISMEDQSIPRPFQFVITSTGNLRFDGISAGGQHQVAIPTSGDDGFAANEWFHVAVTYNGAANTADNLNFYWTRLSDYRTQANLIGSAQLTTDLSTGTAYFTVGNEARSAGGENLKGLIDEVRISNIARGADDMIFDSVSIPEPSSLALIGLGVAWTIGLRRRGK